MTQAEVKQTETEAPQPSAEGDDAQEPSLDTLLSEYDGTPKEAPKEAPQPTAAPVSDDVRDFMQRQMRKEQNQAISEAAQLLRESVGQTNLSEKWFAGQLHVAAIEDPRIEAAFNNRDANPGAWRAIVKQLGHEMAKELKDAPKTDEASTESWNAVEASVHSASTSKAAEKELNWSGMTDAEFQAAKAKLR